MTRKRQPSPRLADDLLCAVERAEATSFERRHRIALLAHTWVDPALSAAPILPSVTGQRSATDTRARRRLRKTAPVAA